MKGYWLILGGKVIDQDAQKIYGALWAPIAERYHAKIKILDAETVIKEGQEKSRALVVEFPTYEDAKACYESEAYQHALQFALKGSTRELLLLEGTFA